MGVELRPARHADVAAVRSVATAAWQAAHESIIGADTVESFLAEHYDVESVRARVDHDDALFPVAVRDDAVVGFALAGPTDADDGVYALSQLYVSPDCWGAGIGSRLLDAVEERVAAAGGVRISLDVMAGNDRAIGFYESAGYRRTDESYDERIDATAYTYEKALE